MFVFFFLAALVSRKQGFYLQQQHLDRYLKNLIERKKAVAVSWFSVLSLLETQGWILSWVTNERVILCQSPSVQHPSTSTHSSIVLKSKLQGHASLPQQREVLTVLLGNTSAATAWSFIVLLLHLLKAGPHLSCIREKQDHNLAPQQWNNSSAA